MLVALRTKAGPSQYALSAVTVQFDQLIASHLRTHGGSYADAARAIALANPDLAQARNRAMSLPIVNGVPVSR